MRNYDKVFSQTCGVITSYVLALWLLLFMSQKILKKNCYLPLKTFLVQAPSKLTTFKWDPRWIIIFSSDMRALRATMLPCERIIFTATVVFGSVSMPIASPFKTRPNAPAPNCLPSIKNTGILSFYSLINIYLINEINEEELQFGISIRKF